MTAAKTPKASKLATGSLTKRQKEVLAELERLARRLGLKVSSGRLLFAGLKLKGGRCSLKDQPWLVLDRLLPYEDQVEAFKRAFLEMAPGAGIPESMARHLSRETRDVLRLAGQGRGLLAPEAVEGGPAGEAALGAQGEARP